jgi:riboflavin transporter FmnP
MWWKKNNTSRKNMAQQPKEPTLFENVKQYLDLKLEYLRLDLSEKLSVLVGKLILVGLLGIMGLAVLILILLLLNNLLTQWIGIEWLATLVEIVLMVVAMFAVWHFKDKLIINPVANSIIQTIFDTDKEDEHDEK